MLTLEQLSTQLDMVAACLMRSPISSKAMDHLHSKLEKLDFEIFCKACEKMSLECNGKYMPNIKEIYAFYFRAKAETREANEEWKGCKFCNEGLVHYERHKKSYQGPITYVGWCGHCNPPFDKKGKHKMFSDREYPGITFSYYDFQFEGGGGDLRQDKAVVKAFTGTEDREKERARERSKEQPGYVEESEISMELPF